MMPTILSKSDEEKWLDSSLSKTEIECFLKPFDEKKMEAYQINNDFIKKTPNDRSILQHKE